MLFFNINVLLTGFFILKTISNPVRRKVYLFKNKGCEKKNGNLDRDTLNSKQKNRHCLLRPMAYGLSVTLPSHPCPTF